MRITKLPALVLFYACSVLFASEAYAQPTDDEIRKDLSSPGVLSIELSKTGGSKVWSKADLQYYWERGAVVTRSANLKEYPDAKVEIGGLATYFITSGQYRYKKFYVTWNSYTGIPTPSDDDIVNHIGEDISQFVGSARFSQIVSHVDNLRIAEDRKSEWHTPNSFSINLACRYQRVVSYTEVSDYESVYRVRFYRDSIEAPWKPRFLSTLVLETELSKTKYDQKEIKAMPSLRDLQEEERARAELNALPQVAIPELKSDFDYFLFIHRTLREGTPESFEATMRQLLAPNSFIEGSRTRLSPQGRNLIDRAIKGAFKGESTYAENYAADPKIKHHQQGMIEFWNRTKQKKTRIALGMYWDDELKQDVYRVTALDVWTLTHPRDIHRLRTLPEQTPAQGTTAQGTPAQKAPTQGTPAQGSASQPSLASPAAIPAPQAAPWHQHRSQKAKVSVEMPAAPTEKVQSLGNGMTQYSFDLSHPTGAYQLWVIDLGSPRTAEQHTQLLDSVAQSFVKGNQAFIQTKADEDRNGIPGRNHVLQRNAGGRRQVMHYHVFGTGQYLYQMILSYPRGQERKNETERFFGSFRAE